MKKTFLSGIIFLVNIILSSYSHAVVWSVGPTRTFKMPSQVSGLVADGDIVEIDAADYVDCTTWTANNLTLKEEEYVHPAARRPRVNNGTIDIGAFEFGNLTRVIPIEDTYSDIQIFPNPAGPQIFILGVKGSTLVAIYNSLGELVLSKSTLH
jgi:hypothetical protein